MTWRVEQGDCRDIMRGLDDNSVDAIVSDPPYGLAFMGKEWDHGVPGVEFWREALRVAKPGAHLLAFGGTRTFHRLAVAIEDAGWDIRDCVMWVYGSGFPKSHAIDKAIDKRGGQTVGWFGPWFRQWREANGITQKQVAKLFPSKTGNLTGCVANWELGFNLPTPDQFNLIRDTFGLPFATLEAAERDVIGTRTGVDTSKQSIARATSAQGLDKSTKRDFDITAPATDAAKQWHGWGTALKPAWEPIIVARKPLIGTVAENVLTHGTGALNIDGCRVGTGEDKGVWPVTHRRHNDIAWTVQPVETDKTKGRWPANVIHDGSEDVMGLFPQTGVSAGGRSGHTAAYGGGYKQEHYGDALPGFGDSGSAARFFYCAKTSKAEREAGLDGMPARIYARSNGAQAAQDRGELYDPNTVGLNRATITTNNHPTVKPIALMRYLCRLVTPPGGLVLDPFNGSGSTGCAAVLEGFDYLGCELDEHYVNISRARIAHWQATAEPSLGL